MICIRENSTYHTLLKLEAGFRFFFSKNVHSFVLEAVRVPPFYNNTKNASCEYNTFDISQAILSSPLYEIMAVKLNHELRPGQGLWHPG